MIVLPKTKDDGFHGLHRDGRGVWTIRWTEHGKTKTKSARTRDPLQAKKARDHLYNRLRAERGALTRGTPEHAIEGDLYIYERSPYQVQVPGFPPQDAETRVQAREIRNHLVAKRAAMGGAR